ncbi:hypothetical protein ACT009_09125 [Sphingomonas sp. Tas61C01]|uniref:hypothetical protein n=1 Tax=Sphingomonas sp. Tas61C01 TaxID=3458297 RepID=UPI00403E8F67
MILNMVAQQILSALASLSGSSWARQQLTRLVIDGFAGVTSKLGARQRATADAQKAAIDAVALQPQNQPMTFKGISV